MMEVAARPTVGLKEHGGLPSSIMHGGKEKRVAVAVAVAGQRSNGFCFIREEDVVDEVDNSSSESSSIGAESSSEDDEDAQSQLKDVPLGSLDSLEDSLPIKRGLSNYFTGKSKSFASLADVHVPASAGELAKPESPFNKRRRILMACKSSWSRRASYSSLLPPLPPLTAEDDDDEETAGALLPPLPRHLKEEKESKKTFRSPRSFSLSDLQRA